MRTLILLAPILISGCTIIEEKMEKNAFDEYRKMSSSPDIVSQEAAKPQDLQELLKKDITSSTERNKIQGQLLANSEINCGIFIEKTHMGRAAQNLMIGTYSNIASTAAAIVSGRAGQNLAGASSVLGYYQNNLNQEFYSGILAPTLTGEIMSRREELSEQIYERQKLSIDKYPYQTAIMDAVRYHNLCSIPVALVRLINKKDATKQLDYNAAIDNIDNEIQKQSQLLKSTELSLSDSEKKKLRDQIMDLTKRREILATSLLQKTTPPLSENPAPSTTTKPNAVPSDTTKPVNIAPTE
ncbi:hypothetical protein [Pseudomonas sp. zfem005]|uniref:hypothetical protein n=1 Tax=Pseudomonas sp. zfem005 TaxID=3078200 RepID=UPI002927A030|nr:hypothetical protein [Pseudomonas sp. zfem005]MDU9414423.1 hypothetical protein [Pseudomonas sp. zfem005]